MAYGERQIDLIRDRLKNYKDDPSGEPRGTGQDLSNEISDKTGLRMSDEALRIFVHRPGGRVRVPTEENLRALISFLTHPEIRMLSPEELRDAGTS